MMLASHQDLYLASPWVNAAGMLGFAPVPSWNWELPPGAFITNPVSLTPRSPAENRAFIPFPGGFLLHTGLPNPGIKTILRQNRQRWQRSAVPIWVSLLGSKPEEIHQLVRILEEAEGVMAVQLELPANCSLEQVKLFIQAAAGELPIILSIPITHINESILSEAASWGISALCLSAPRGMLPTAGGNITPGRLYGPALYPLCLSALHNAQKAGIPIICGCGIYTRQQGETLLSSGAWAVQLDSILWRG
jgi:dihydroorotate dehydrogenase